ncbi:MAG: PASTA domain-containing protein [Gemmatimonadota bacterium]
MNVKTIGIIAGAAVLMFVAGYFIAVRILFPPLPEPENGIAVPNLIGLRVDNAEAQLRQLSLRLTEVSELEHPGEPEGTIIAQSPLPGQQLRELGAVRLAVSAGPGHVEAPPTPPLPPPAPPPLDTVVAADTALPPDTVSFYRQ